MATTDRRDLLVRAPMRRGFTMLIYGRPVSPAYLLAAGVRPAWLASPASAKDIERARAIQEGPYLSMARAYISAARMTGHPLP